MEWTECIKKVLAYIERHLLEEICIKDIAEQIYLSPFYLQNGFRMMSGYTIGEYIRYRRLYLAALDVIAGEEKVIDLAFKYGYDTPESFTKAFTRFHGVSPMQMRKNPFHIRTFLPLKIRVSIQGGNEMEYKAEQMQGFKVIGFSRDFSMENAYAEIPKFWNEFWDKYSPVLTGQRIPETEIEQYVCNCGIGKYGICIDNVKKDGQFCYMIAGDYYGGSVPKEMEVYEIPGAEWVKFHCVGPMPGALQALNTRIFKEWMPENSEYEISMGINIEWYAKGNPKTADYESGIWIPVRRKQ